MNKSMLCISLSLFCNFSFLRVLASKEYFQTDTDLFLLVILESNSKKLFRFFTETPSSSKKKKKKKKEIEEVQEPMEEEVMEGKCYGLLLLFAAQIKQFNCITLMLKQDMRLSEVVSL